ncbi:MBL fold metallo-hydrolase [Humibacter ginsenosidimutans]|uniref:MBL fold metallo-hydrolase n=1 Tax=Humibacter ginsenosidimutans TaxID=2599293 RepID=A0A5B8M6G6_9MICO|nr:MBL fold metallo-hydrolase [Humibacter ginsenosidimutans]QDZ15709.1 MBL fold metallo-hydrolase [Humibacter ginsenosidimutans]
MTRIDTAHDATTLHRSDDTALVSTLAREVVAFAAMPKGLVRPRRPRGDFARTLRDAPFPEASASVTLTAFRQPVRDIPTLSTAEGLRHPSRVGNAMTSFVVKHPDATVLVDAALCDDFEPRVLSHLPSPYRVFVRPAEGSRSVRASLADEGLTFADVDFALATHLHWDHVSGLVDAPDLVLHATRADWEWAMNGPRAPIGVVREALRGRATELFELDGPPVLTFERSHDLFGDGSVTAVGLAGHTPGSVGYLLHLGDVGLHTPASARWVLLIGDAVWHGVQLDHRRQKPTFPGRLVDADRDAAYESIQRIAALAAGIPIVATHDPDAAAPFFAPA